MTRSCIEEAQWLAAGERVPVDRRLGVGSFVEDLGMVFGYTAREARDRLAVARGLVELQRPQPGASPDLESEFADLDILARRD